MGYIKYLLSSNNVEASKNLFIYQKKAEAFDKLISYVPLLNSMVSDIGNELQILNGRITFGLSDTRGFYDGELNQIKKIINKYSDFYYFIKTFSVRYDHFFLYDFADSRDFEKCIENARLIDFFLEKLYKSFLDTGNSSLPKEIDSI